MKISVIRFGEPRTTINFFHTGIMGVDVTSQFFFGLLLTFSVPVNLGMCVVQRAEVET